MHAQDCARYRNTTIGTDPKTVGCDAYAWRLTIKSAFVVCKQYVGQNANNDSTILFRSVVIFADVCTRTLPELLYSLWQTTETPVQRHDLIYDLR